MPVVIPMVLRCDGCNQQTTGEIVLQSKLDWDLRHEENWEIDQKELRRNLLDLGPAEEFETKVWCSPACKEKHRK